MFQKKSICVAGWGGGGREREREKEREKTSNDKVYGTKC